MNDLFGFHVSADVLVLMKFSDSTVTESHFLLSLFPPIFLILTVLFPLPLLLLLVYIGIYM